MTTSRPATTFSAVVFDLDGTLVDSSEDIADALNHAIAVVSDRRVTPSAVVAAFGEGPRVLVEKCLQSIGLTPSAAQVDRVLADYSARYAAYPVEKTKLLDTAAAVLPVLHGRGVAIGVCTNKLTLIARALIDRLGLAPVVGAVIGCDATAHPKPDPRHVTETVVALGADATDALYVGDTNIDQVAAAAAGMPYAHVAWGHEGVPADFQIESFDDLLTIVRAN